MRAIVFEKPGEFSLTEVPDPVPGPREAVVRVEAVGICGTDLHVLDGEFAPTVFPIASGHEASGVVVSVGEEVTDVAPGDPVALDPSFYCGECWFCMVGRGNLCENWDGAGVARTDGSAAELVRSPARNLHRLPSSVDLALAALIERHAFALFRLRGCARDLPRRHRAEGSDPTTGNRVSETVVNGDGTSSAASESTR